MLAVGGRSHGVLTGSEGMGGVGDEDVGRSWLGERSGRRMFVHRGH